MKQGPARHVMSCLATAWPVTASQGTTIVRARRPINAAVVGSVRARWCPAMYGKFGCGLETTLVQARGWINASGVGWVRSG